MKTERKRVSFLSNRSSRSNVEGPRSFADLFIFFLGGVITAIFIFAELLNLRIIEIDPEHIEHFRKNYGEQANWVFGGMMVLLVVLALYFANNSWKQK